jgi:hypothetical protein
LHSSRSFILAKAKEGGAGCRYPKLPECDSKDPDMQKAMVPSGPARERQSGRGQKDSRDAQTPQAGQLGQLGSLANQSPSVQTQLKLKQALQESAQVRAQQNLAASINAGQTESVQLKPHGPAQRANRQKKEANGTGQHAPAMQHQSDTGRNAGPAILQAVWVDDPESPTYFWDPPVDGVVWFALKESPQLMFFRTRAEESAKRYGHLEGHVKPREEWVKLHGSDPMKRKAATVVAISQIQEEQEKALADFEGYAKKGHERYGRLRHAPGALPEKTAKAREEFFHKAYASEELGARDRDKENPYAPVDYKSALKKELGGDANKKGLYQSEYDLAAGQITAHQNYGGGEQYLNPETGKLEPYNNSEVIYQQWKIAKKEIPKALSQLNVLRRAHIAGDAIPVVKSVKTWLYKNDKNFISTKDYECRNGHPCFFALLAAANCSAAIYLIADHGREIGIRDITSIILKAGESIEINFA